MSQTDTVIARTPSAAPGTHIPLACPHCLSTEHQRTVELVEVLTEASFSPQQFAAKILADNVSHSLSRRDRCTRAIAAVYIDNRQAADRLPAVIDAAADAAGVSVLDHLLVTGGRWTSLACTDPGCAHGRRLWAERALVRGHRRV